TRWCAQSDRDAFRYKDLQQRINQRRLANARTAGDDQHVGSQRCAQGPLLAIGKHQLGARLDPGDRSVGVDPRIRTARQYGGDAAVCSVARVGGVAEGAVSSEPVSPLQIPCSRGKYREFRDFARTHPLPQPKTPDIARVSRANSLDQPNREFFQQCREKNPLMREIAPFIRETDSNGCSTWTCCAPKKHHRAGDPVQSWFLKPDRTAASNEVDSHRCRRGHPRLRLRAAPPGRVSPWLCSSGANPPEGSLREVAVHYTFLRLCSRPNPQNEPFMADQIVITEKTSQAKDIRAAVGSRYGDVLPAEGHLFDLLEPEDVVPAWKRWSPILLRPEGLYGTRPAEGGNKAAKLKAIRAALRTAKRVWLATDCDREGQLIGQEILEHYAYRGQVMRVLFTAQDPQTIRDAFGRAKPNAEYARLYAAAVARRQADQIYNLSLTRTATVILGQGRRRVIGVGRVKTPTLAIVCKRELEIRNFEPIAYFEVVATARVAGGQFQMRHAPQERILKREVAETVVNAAHDFESALTVHVEDKRQGPPKLHDLPSLQKLCGARFGWPAGKTLEVAQELYDGAAKKIITYPRAEVRYLPQNLIADVPKIVAGLQVGQTFKVIPMPEPPIIRKGASGSFYDKALEGASQHAVTTNVNTIDKLREA